MLSGLRSPWARKVVVDNIFRFFSKPFLSLEIGYHGDQNPRHDNPEK
jgi:hypothetical protein